MKERKRAMSADYTEPLNGRSSNSSPNPGISVALRKRHLINNVKGWLFSMWPLVGYVLFFGIPFITSIFLSFTELHSFDISQYEFVGFENFKWIFTDPKHMFWFSLRQTFYYSLSLPIGIVLGLFTAVLLTRGVKGTRVFRTIMFIPSVCSIVGVSMMWKMVLSRTGLINLILVTILGPDKWEAIDWLKDPNWFMPAVIFTTTWTAGSGSLLFQAALEQVNKSLIEAAEIDGAGRKRIFFSVTLPAISPTTFYVLVMNMIGTFQSFANIQVLAGSGTTPMDQNGNCIPMTSVYLIYYMAFDKPFLHGLGRASACAWILAIIIGVITIIIFKFSKYWVCYDD